MPSLPEQLHALARAIVADEAPAPAEAAFGRERLAVYRHAYRARLEEALRVNYPALATVLGDEGFSRVAAAHAARRPPAHYSIRWHGADLFADLPPGPLAELARMDWALGEAFDAADADAVDPGSLARHPPGEWAGLAFALHPSVRVLMMGWAVEPLWEAARKSPQGPFAQPASDRHALVAWRLAREAHWRVATQEEGRALCALGRLGTLEAVCGGESEDDAARIGEWFAGWVQGGLLVRRGEAPR